MSTEEEQEAISEETRSADESQQQEEGDKPEPRELPSLDLAFEIAGQRYRDEERRRNNVESKLGTVATIDALVIGLAALYADSSAVLIAGGTVLSVISALIALYGIWPRSYGRPGEVTADLYDIATDETDERKEKLLLGYINSADENTDTNENKYAYLKICIILTFLALLLVGAVPVGSGVGQLSSMIDTIVSSY